MLGRLAEYSNELRSLLRCYPPFVIAKRSRATELTPGDVPIFVLHTIEPERFEAQLVFLREAGFRTIGLEELRALHTGRARGTGKEVVLTIDDARSSLWRFGFPLLEKHRAQAIVFAITGFTKHAPPRASLADGDGGPTHRAALHALDPHDARLCSWEELAIMRGSGLVDIESHTHLHRRIFVGTKLERAVEESTPSNASDPEYSAYLTPAGVAAEPGGERYLGYPLFPMAPLFGSEAAIEVDATAAREFAAAWRGSDPHERKNLRKLKTLLPASALRRVGREELGEWMRDDLAVSQAALQSELGDPLVGRHLCLPYTSGSSMAVEVARGLGFESVYWGVRAGRRSNPPGSDPFHMVRIKDDFIWRLPARGRHSLASIYFSKAARRMSGAMPY